MVSHGFHGFHGLFHRCDRPCRADSVGWLYGDDVTLCHPNRVSLACEASTETMKTMETIRDGAGTRRRGERGAILLTSNRRRPGRSPPSSVPSGSSVVVFPDSSRLEQLTLSFMERIRLPVSLIGAPNFARLSSQCVAGR